MHLAEKALRIGRDDLARDFRHIGAEEPVRQLGGVTLTHPEMCTLMYTNTYVYIYIYKYYRRKFRSQTSDNMDGWKSRGGKSQRREEQKREDQRRERVRRKQMQVCEQVGKS